MKELKNEYEITFYEENGHLYPDLTLPEQTHYPIGKYGDLHLAYLKAHKKATYTTLLTTCKLNEYLHQVCAQAHRSVEAITRRLADEALKASNGLLWAQEMNNCRLVAEESVLKEIIFN